jgi:hypothetical protein
MRSTRRYRFSHGHAANVIDLGLRLEDVEGLETEDVFIDAKLKARANLRENGATEHEIDFLLHHRVELNAFASDEFVAWLERKLEQHGIAKVVPDGDALAAVYLRMRKQAAVQDHIDDLLGKLEDEPAPPVPDDLVARIREKLSELPELSWDAVLRDLAEDDHEEAQS